MPLIKAVLPYAVSGIICASIAWSIQANRLTSSRLETQQCEAEHDSYVNQQLVERLAYEDESRRRSNAAGQAYATAESALGEANEKLSVYRRCLNAGKCPPGLLNTAALPACGSTSSLSSTNGADGSSAYTVPTTGKPTEEATAIQDCAIATLRANYLQSLIERQPGYFYD